MGLGFAFIGMMAYFFYLRILPEHGVSPLGALGGRSSFIPTPWIAAEMGWFVAEFGRQPWTVGRGSADRDVGSATSAPRNC